MTFAIRENSRTTVNTPPILDANELTNDAGLAHIQLGDQLYTLRITKAGKLILTK